MMSKLTLKCNVNLRFDIFDHYETYREKYGKLLRKIIMNIGEKIKKISYYPNKLPISIDELNDDVEIEVCVGNSSGFSTSTNNNNKKNDNYDFFGKYAIKSQQLYGSKYLESQTISHGIRRLIKIRLITKIEI